MKLDMWDGNYIIWALLGLLEDFGLYSKDNGMLSNFKQESDAINLLFKKLTTVNVSVNV